MHESLEAEKCKSVIDVAIEVEPAQVKRCGQLDR